ncbi:MAG: FHA domain-containing protein [bacterium]|nr:FHA domain-containing protein [bacterium]
MFGRKKKQKNEIDDKAAGGGVKARSPLGDISKMLNASGRIALPTLQKLAELYPRTEFIVFMEQPVLVGSSIQSGSLNLRNHAGKEEVNRTVVFEVDLAEERSSPSETLKHAIYPLVKGEFAIGSINFFMIGRIDGNDMIMPDYVISKQHAILEIKRGAYTIRDCGSTNGTMINGKRLGKKPVNLRNGDVVGFARYEFTFLHPEPLYDMLGNSEDE